MNERTKFIYFNEALKKVDFLGDEIKNDRDLARWAYQVVCTRAFGEEGDDQRIAPIADMVREQCSEITHHFPPSNSLVKAYLNTSAFHALP